MAQNGEKEVRCRNAVINGEFGKGGGVCHCYYKTKLSVVAMATPCLLYTELSHGLAAQRPAPPRVWGLSKTVGLTVWEAGGSAPAFSC